MRDMAQLPFPDERILSQTESGRPKTERLMELEAAHPGLENHFVEDKLSTLEKVCQARPGTRCAFRPGDRIYFNALRLAGAVCAGT